MKRPATFEETLFMLLLVALTLSGIGLMVFLGGRLEKKRREHLGAHARRLGLAEDPFAIDRGFLYLTTGTWNGADLALGVRPAKIQTASSAAAPEVIEIAAVGQILAGPVHLIPRERIERALQEGHAVAALSGDTDFDARIAILTPVSTPKHERSSAFAPAPSVVSFPWLTGQLKELLLRLKAWRHLSIHDQDYRITLNNLASTEDIDIALSVIQHLVASSQSSGTQGPFR